MNSFKTHSTVRKPALWTVYTFIALFALAFLGLKIAVVTWLFFEGIVLFSFCLSLFFVTRARWIIEFKNNNILLLNTGTRQSYCFENLRRSDIILKQSKSQVKKNSCDMKVLDTPFGIYDVQCYNELLKYLQENMPDARG